MGFRVVLSLVAESDLGEIVRYIAQDDRATAGRVAREIAAHARILENFPRMGRAVPEFNKDTIREIIHRPYRIIYQVNDSEETVEVLRIWHAARGTPEVNS